MRILHVPHAYAPATGGAEHYCQRIGEELVAIGQQVDVLTSDFLSAEGFYDSAVAGADGPARLRMNGVLVERVPLSSSFWRTAHRATVRQPRLGEYVESVRRRHIAARFTRALARRIEIDRPDVVMTLPHLFGNVRCVLSVRRKVEFPLVMVPMLHESDPFWDRGTVASALEAANAVIALTHHERSRLIDSYGVKPESVFVCPPAADEISSTQEASRPKRVLYVGRKSLTKGIPLLVDAMGDVWAAHPDAELVLAGRREEATIDLVRALEDLPPALRNRVSSLDDISEEAKHDLLATSSCLVLPSIQESFGMVILEAWSHGTPVVALDIPAIRETVEHGVDGILVEPGNPRVLAKAIMRLLTNDQFARRLGDKGRTKVESTYNWRKSALRVLEAYEHAIQQPAGQNQ